MLLDLLEVEGRGTAIFTVGGLLALLPGASSVVCKFLEIISYSPFKAWILVAPVLRI
jgi:hypothetical protein